MTAITTTRVTEQGRAGRETLLAARRGLHRYALWTARRETDLVTEEDVLAAADLAMVQAWRRHRADGGASFATFARRWVHGAVRRLVRDEGRARRPLEGRVRVAHTTLEATGPPPDAGCLAHELVAVLTPDESEVLLAHEVGRAALAEIARRHGRHPAWATRVRRRALERLRAVA